MRQAANREGCRMTLWASRRVLQICVASLLLVGLLAIPSRVSAGSVPSSIPFGNASDSERPLTNEGTSEVRKNSTDLATGDGSPRFEGNMVRDYTKFTLRLEGTDSVTTQLDGLGMAGKTTDSTVAGLLIPKGAILVANRSWDKLDADRGRTVTISWSVRIQLLSDNGKPVPGVSLKIIDAFGITVARIQTDENGLTPALSLDQARISSNGTLVLNPYTIVVDTDGGTQEFRMMVDANGIFTFVIQSPIEGQPLVLMAVAAVAFAVGIVGFAPRFSTVRSRLAKLLPFIPIYTRVSREDIIEQATRGRIIEYVEQNPGKHFGAIRDALSLSNGNAIYHLRVLEREGLVKSRTNGMYKRFYSKDVNLPPNDVNAILAT